MNNQPKEKIGVLGFDYENFHQFKRRVDENGFFTSNLGDNIQTVATKLLLKKIGINDEKIVTINRDSISSYNGEKIKLITNGVLYKWFFPLPENIIPIFIGVCISESIIKENIDCFMKYQPIGCRDSYTDSLFKKNGIQSYVSGCITLTLPKRENSPDNGKVVIVYGDRAGEFPAQALGTIPQELLRNLDFKYQRCPHFNAPLSKQQISDNERYAEYLLDYYRENASLIVTPLHHAAAPCIAMNIPVILCRESRDERFSFLEKITEIYYADRFHLINWKAKSIDIESIKNSYEEDLKNRIFNIEN